MVDELMVLPYSKKDPQEVLEILKQQLPKFTGGKWTDFLDSDLGYALIKTYVSIFDLSNYFTDQQLAESFLALCSTREAAIRIAKQLNYIPKRPTPASVQAQLVFPVFQSQFTLAADSLWSIRGKTFICPSAIIFPPNQTTLNISLIQGTRYNSNFTATGVNWYRISVPKNLSNMVVKVNGEVWEAVDSWIGVTEEKSYKVYEDVTALTILFGANMSTNAPLLGDTINVTGILTEGAAGNIETVGNPIKPLGQILLLGNPIQNSFSGTNIVSALGGQDAESIDEIRKNAPAFYSTQGRCVTALDYEAEVNALAEVHDAIVIGGETINRYGEVWVIVYGENPYTVSPDLLDLIKSKILKKNMITMTVVVIPPKVVEIKHVVHIGVDQQISTDLSVNRLGVSNATAELYDSLRIGQSIYESDLLPAFKTVKGVKWGRVSTTVRTFANSQAGVIKIPLILNHDLTSCVLKKLNGDTLFSGNGQSKIVTESTGIFLLHNTDDQQMVDQKCTLDYIANSDDVILQWDQLLVLTDLSINMEFA